MGDSKHDGRPVLSFFSVCQRRRRRNLVAQRRGIRKIDRGQRHRARAFQQPGIALLARGSLGESAGVERDVLADWKVGMNRWNHP